MKWLATERSSSSDRVKTRGGKRLAQLMMSFCPEKDGKTTIVRISLSAAFIKVLGWMAGDMVEMSFEDGHVQLFRVIDGSGRKLGKAGSRKYLRFRLKNEYADMLQGEITNLQGEDGRIRFYLDSCIDVIGQNDIFTSSVRPVVRFGAEDNVPSV